MDILFRKSKAFKYLLWVTALIVAGCSAYYSVFGLSHLFAGASLAVILMASALEIGKLVSATFLHRYWEHISIPLKTYLTMGVVVLMTITSAGVYGFLSNAYQITASQLETVSSEVQLLENEKQIYVKQVSSLEFDKKAVEERISTLNSIRVSQENNLTTLYSDTSRVRSTRSVTQAISETDSEIKRQFSRIDSLNAKMRVANDSVSAYDRRINDAKNTDVASELGPLIYLSNLTGYDMDVVINWFILLIVVVFDPLAVSLVIAASFLSKKQMENHLDGTDEDSIFDGSLESTTEIEAGLEGDIEEEHEEEEEAADDTVKRVIEELEQEQDNEPMEEVVVSDSTEEDEFYGDEEHTEETKMVVKQHKANVRGVQSFKPSK